MKTKVIYTNGISLFTLENFGKTAGVCEFNNISIHSEVSKMKLMNLHSIGKVYYVFGTGDRKELSGVSLNRKIKLSNFEVH